MAKKATFEQALHELEEAVSRLEQGQLPLDDALACFESGVRNAQRCREILRNVEGRVEVLLKDAEGVLRPEPFDLPGGTEED